MVLVDLEDAKVLSKDGSCWCIFSSTDLGRLLCVPTSISLLI